MKIDTTYGTGVNTLFTGDELISQERTDQVFKHNYPILYDISHNGNNELIMMAEALINHKYSMSPDNWDRGKVDKMMAKTLIQRYVLAGSLIAAEIDRLCLQAKIAAKNKIELEGN